MNKLKKSLIKKIFRITVRFNLKRPLLNIVCFASEQPSDKFGSFEGIAQYLNQKKVITYNLYGRINSIKAAYKIGYYLARSKIVVVDQAYQYLSYIGHVQNKYNIQVWHAAGAYKKFGRFTIDFSNEKALENQIKIHGFYSYVIVSSPYVIKYYAKAFNMPESNILPYGTTRLVNLKNKLTNEIYIKERIYESYNIDRKKKLILYAPTFREVNNKRDYFPSLDLFGFLDLLSDDYIVGIRLHPRAPKSIKKKYSDVDLKYKNKLFNFSFISQEDAIIASDFVLTDYSSIIFDAAYIDKPILFYVPDIDVYSRGVFERPPESLSFSSMFELHNFFNNLTTEKLNFVLNESIKIKDKYLSSCNDDSISRIGNFVELLLNNK